MHGAWMVASFHAAAAAAAAEADAPPPFVTVPTKWLPESIDVSKIPSKDVISYAQPAAAANMDSCDALGYTVTQPVVIGQMPQMSEADTLQVLQEAIHAWNGGMGVWTLMSLQERCRCIQDLLNHLLKSREAIVQALQWEIGKNRNDAEAEFDRTLQFAELVLESVRKDPEYGGAVWETLAQTRAITRRHAIGIILALAPYNYPLNESYAAVIPALLLGNIVILKIPTTGGLAHLLTFEAIREALPPGTLNFISGGGRETMPPLVRSGLIDGLAFIGSGKAADQLIHQHPQPHRLNVFLQLEAKNMAIVLSDVFQPSQTKELEHTIKESIKGSLSFNGQRCTALKLFFVPTNHADIFVQKLTQAVEALSVGLSWQKHGDHHQQQYSQITPLTNPSRIQYMQELLQDALDKGAQIINKNGGQVVGGPDSTLMIPAVVYPVTSDMRLYHEEQFGPLVPVATYDTLDTVLEYARQGPYAQQVSIFGHDAAQVARLVDAFSAIFGKINLNQQCGRSPDTLPFSGRRSSAMGTMSVTEALREFSVPTVIATAAVATALNEQDENGDAFIQQVNAQSKFLETMEVIVPQ